MALLTEEQRKKRFEYLGLGEYNEANIRKFQKKYLRKQDVDGEWGINSDNALRHVYNVKRYTKSFAPEEFKCDCGGRYCTGYPTYMKKAELINLQKIRNHYGVPMEVTQGVRCTGRNRELRGSVVNSGHLKGYACDFYMGGVTDTLANRKAAIKWMKKLDNTEYIYGDGINSYGYAVNAPYMGNAMHYEAHKPKTVATEKKQTNGQKLAEKAWKFAYHSNTTKANYKKTKDKKTGKTIPAGKPKPAYTKALDKYFGKVRKWSMPARKGASCDVFDATCIRAAGLGNAPRGMGRSWMDASDNFKRVNNPTPNNVKDGDIISIIWNNGLPHWAIVYKGKVLEASYGGWYPKATNTLKSRLSKSGKQSVVVYRAK